MEEKVIFSIPGEMLLLFAILVWAVFYLIYRSDPQNPMNRWSLAGGLIFGIGVLKEYLYYEIGPILIARGYWTEGFSQKLYSALSAVFYYLAIPTVLMFCCCFAHLDRKNPKRFHRNKFLVFLPAVILTVLYPPFQVLSLQHDKAFCLIVAFYDCCYGFTGAVIVIRALWQERRTSHFRQRRMAALVILIPLFSWLIIAFPWHALGKGKGLSKLWQGNVIVMAFILFYLLFWMFHGGIWGFRLKGEHYDWEADSGLLRENAGYVAHALKNELAKIDWSLSLLHMEGVEAEELAVIAHSVDYLKEFIHETQLHSGRIVLNLQKCRVQEIFDESVLVLDGRGGAQVSIARCDSSPLYCDRTHVTEVLRNLLLNASEAAGKYGHIELSYCYERRFLRNRACILVKDDGPGIPEEEIQNIFNPFYTTRTSGRNMGLGLYYCRNVMQSHGGRIEAESKNGNGSTFTLWFPVKRGS